MTSLAGQEAAEAAAQGTRLQSVARAARLLSIVASAPEHDRTVKELATRLGVSTGTTYHLLNTLVDAKLLTRDRHRQYHLGLAVGRLAAAYYRQTQAPLELTAPLAEVVESTGESAYLSAWRYGELEILAHLPGTHAVRVMDLKEGFHGAAHARASGKVLLALTWEEERVHYLNSHRLIALTAQTITDRDSFDAELAAVANQGYGTDEEEFSPGVSCVSVPVLHDKALVGAYTLSAPVERYKLRKEEYLSRLKQAAEDAARAMD